MARVLVVSGGYRGDVFPFVPVAAELAKRGHQVRFLVPADFHDLLAGEAFEVPPAESMLGPAFLDQYAAFMARWGLRLGGARVPGLMLQVVAEHLEQIVEGVDPHAAWADVMLTHPIVALSAAIAAERHDLPWIVGELFPMLLPSGSNRLSGSPNLGAAGNRFAWRVARASLFDRVSHATAFKQVRRKFGLSVAGWNLVDARSSPYLNVGLFSPHYVPIRPDWPQPFTTAGFTYWEGPAGWQLPDDVAAFLDAGPSPVAVTLGTSAASAHPEVFSKVAKALDALDQRGVFLTSTPDISASLQSQVGSRHGVWPFVPLAPLLRHCKAIVHSGAHGTNALALRAGLPSAIHPCLTDQVWHLRRQEQLGTGIKLDRNAPKSIERLLGDDNLSAAARDFSAHLRTEDGPANAARAVESVLA